MKRLFDKVLALFLLFCFTLCSPLLSEARTLAVEPGTRIPITIYSTVNSDNLKTGDMISVSVSEPVKVGGVVLFKKGSTGVLNVSKSVKSGGHGRAGQLEINGGRITDVFGNVHPISASLSSQGSSKRGVGNCIYHIGDSLDPGSFWLMGRWYACNHTGWSVY